MYRGAARMTWGTSKREGILEDPEPTVPASASRPLLRVPQAQQLREARAANLRALQAQAWRKTVRRLQVQCILLTLVGVPVYGLAWHLTDPTQTRLAVAAALFLSYATPLVRILIFHVRATARGDY